MKTVGIKSRGAKGGPVKRENASLKETKFLKAFRITLIVLISAFMVYAPFVRGLYFEEDQLPAEIFIFIVFAAFCIFKMLKKDRRFLETPLDYASFGLVVVYFLSVLFYLVGIRVAAAPRLAVLEWLKYCMYFSVFFMLSELIITLKSKLAVLWVIIGTTAGLSIIGFDGAAGGNIASVLNSIFKFFKINIKIFDVFVTNRIYSTIQYPNAFAAYLVAVLFITIVLIITSRRLWVKAVGGALAFLFSITLIFTQSRGVLIIAPIAAVLFIIAIPKQNIIKCISFGLSVIILAGLITLKLNGYMMANAGQGVKIWLLLLLGMVLSAGLTLLVDYLNKWLEKINWKIVIAVLAGIIIAGIAGVVLVINTPEKLLLSHTDKQPDSPITVSKSAALEPGREYKLVFDVDAKINGDKPEAYSVIINYKREKDIVVNDKEIGLVSYEGKATNGVETREIQFKLPSDSKIVDMYFRNIYQGTQAAFNNAKIIDAASGKTVEKLILKHKYIPDSFTDKFSSMFASRSFIERVLYYKDGVKMFKDRWLLGAGGGAWSYLYFYYQSFLYWSTQAHNYLIQIAVECGLMGIIALIFLFLSIAALFLSEYKYKRNTDPVEKMLQSAIIAGIAVLFMHSFFDFDFSLSAVFLLLWALLGVFNSRYRNSTSEGTVEYGKPVINKILSIGSSLVKIKKIRAHSAFILAAVVIIIFIPVLVLTAKSYAGKAVNISSTDGETAIEYMKNAAQYDPYMPQYRIDYVKLLLNRYRKLSTDSEGKPAVINQETRQVLNDTMNEINKQMKAAEKLSWYSTDLIPQVGKNYFELGELDKGLEAFDRATELRPLRPEEWQQKVSAYYSVVEYFIGNGDKDKALDTIKRIENVKNEAIEANKNNMNPLIFDVKTDEKLEKLLYIKDKLQTAKKEDLDKLTFYSIPDMDINQDGIPDQWAASGGISLGMSNDRKTITAQNKNGKKDSYIQSRQINLAAGKKYRVEIEFQNNPGVDSVPFAFTGVSQENASLKNSGTNYAAELSTPANFSPSSNFLRIFVTGRYDIKAVKITEI